VGDHERRAALDERAQRGSSASRAAASRPAVGSSSTSTGASRSSARAMARRRRSPPLSRLPPVPGEPASRREARGRPRAPARRGPRPRARPGSRRPCLAQRVGHGDVGQQRLLAEHGHRLPHGGQRDVAQVVPVKQTAPAAGSCRRASSATSDDLPAPLGPLRATSSPGRTSRRTSRTTSWSAPRWRTATPRSSTWPRTGAGSGRDPGASVISGSWPSSSRTRSAPAAAVKRSVPRSPSARTGP
jgi:hypothetical protein